VSELAVPSRARRVTLFEDRAEVTRDAEADLTPGTIWVAIAGVSPFVDERSVQARVVPANGDAAAEPRVLSARVRWRAHLERELGREQIEALEAELRAARARAREAEQSLDRAAQAEARAKALRARWVEGVTAVPRGAGKAEAIAAWRASLAAVEGAVAEALASAAATREARQRAEDDYERAKRRLALGSAETPRYEAHVEVELHAPEARRARLEITYRVPCALWRPEHLVRLQGPPPAQGATAPLEVVTLATAWQRTGEPWDDVEVRFSTARPARDASPPPLADDVLVARRKTEHERRVVEVSVREQAVMVAGLDRGTRAVDEMPGVDDGGEPLLFAPKERVSIASDGRPFRVEVARASLEAKIERVVLPEVAKVAHLRATATLEKAGPLLAGPVRIARGKSLVGLGRIGFVGRGEPFEIGLGADDGVRVRRVQTEERETAAVLGTQRIRRKVEVFLGNLSDEPRRVQVTERVPVSEIEDVEVTLTDAGGFKPEGKDGFLRRDVELAAHATEELVIVYEIRAGSKVALPF
jgi:uncharacterized protein (TIGR02231 family)